MTLRGLLRSPLPLPRQLAGWVLAPVVPIVVGLRLHDRPDVALLASLLLLAGTVLVALVGGRRPALVGAVASFLVLNWWFTPPLRHWSIADTTDLVALLVFVVVAVSVATVVDLAARRAEQAVRARREAEALGRLSRSVLVGEDTAEAVVEEVRATFGQRSVVLLSRRDEEWDRVAGTGLGLAASPEHADTAVRVDDDHVLALHGPRLRTTERRLLDAFAVQAGLVLEYRRLREREERAAVLERAEATSTALLRAVSHDLRTPLATLRLAVDGLLSTQGLSEADRKELLDSVAASSAQLERLIENLLDLSRIESGLVHPRLVVCSLDEALPFAVAGLPVLDEIPESAPLVLTDPGLLERVVANLAANAVRAGGPVRLGAREVGDWVELLVVDHGPGVPLADRDRMFAPFQRLDDTSGEGLGLGLAVARGLAEALGGGLRVEDTPGGGLTMVVAVPRAPGAQR